MIFQRVQYIQQFVQQSTLLTTVFHIKRENTSPELTMSQQKIKPKEIITEILISRELYGKAQY